jgi:hypothetical protein
MVCEELGQPLGHCLDRGVRIAVLVEEASITDLETHVVDAINDRVEQLLAPVPGASAIVLNQMKTGLGTRLVVAVQPAPIPFWKLVRR